MKHLLIVSVILSILLSSCTLTLKNVDATPVQEEAAMQVVPVGAGDPIIGLVYALPKTGLRFTVSAQKIEKTRGEFYLYSERYLGLKDVILEDAVEWELENVTLDSYGLADEMFQVASSRGSASPLAQLADDGVILALNSNLNCEKPVVEPIAAAPAAVGGVPYNEAMLMANSTSKMAEEAARYIYRLRESRTALLSSDLDALPPDGEAYGMTLEQIDALEAQFLSLFKGSEVRTTVTETVELVADELIEKDVLFRFSSFAGVVAKDDLSGSPVFITMEVGDFTPLNDEAPSDTAGFYYKRPAPVSIQVLNGSAQVLSQKVLMAQFGELQTLPSSMMTDGVKLQFYPATGALKSIMR